MILALRHGKTAYTDIFPDITKEGEAEVRHFAHTAVLPWITKHSIAEGKLSVIASPAPRAQGTAATILNELARPELIITERKLSPMIWRDNAAALHALGGLQGKGYFDYETEPVFADSKIFETPEEVRLRWYGFFAEYIRSNSKSSIIPNHAILVAHYELLCNLTHDLFGIVSTEENALRHNEPIYLSISPTSTDGHVRILGQFRGKFSLATFDINLYSFVR